MLSISERIKEALSKRLQKYGLKMNEDKTKLVPFSKRKQSRGEDQGTFDFLGFTFYIGKSLKGFPIVKMKTNGKRFRAKLKKMNDWARSIRNKFSLNQIMKTAGAKMRGHVQYYGVSHNYATVNKFIHSGKRILYKWLNRRSQRKSFTWEKFEMYLVREKFPTANICHTLF
jgi:RNA-directed DNA polymerase